jgi:hypothetical protein
VSEEGGVCTQKHRHRIYNVEVVLVYYEARKRELNIRLMYECRFDERLKAPAEALADVYLQENKKGRKPRVCKMSRFENNFFFLP